MGSTRPIDSVATPSVRFAASGVQDLGGDSSQVIPVLAGRRRRGGKTGRIPVCHTPVGGPCSPTPARALPAPSLPAGQHLHPRAGLLCSGRCPACHRGRRGCPRFGDVKSLGANWRVGQMGAPVRLSGVVSRGGVWVSRSSPANIEWTRPIDGEATRSGRCAESLDQDLDGDPSQVIPVLYPCLHYPKPRRSRGVLLD